MKLCHCGKPLHYTSQAAREFVDELVREKGETILVTVNGHTWLVPRHYIALHGLKGHEVDKLGFTEVRSADA